MINVQCYECKSDYKTQACWIKRRKYGFCSKECMGKWRSRTIRGKNHPQYIENTTNYMSVHDWMIKSYGKASRCENNKCLHNSKRFVWALKHGKEYERKRENFKQLCYKCHWQYDFNKKWHKNMLMGSKKRWGKYYEDKQKYGHKMRYFSLQK